MKKSFVDAYLEAQSKNLSAPACIYGGNVISRAALLHMTCHYAKRLHAMGVAPGDVVALSLPDMPAHLAMMLSVARLGAVSLPVHTRTNAAGKRALAKRFGAKWVIVPTKPSDQTKEDQAAGADATARAAATELPYRVVSLKELAPPPDQKISAESLDLKAVCDYWPSPDTPARIALTSGTTGVPSAVQYDHAYWANRIATTVEFCDEGSRVLCGSLALTMGNISAFAALTNGGVAVFQTKHTPQDYLATVNAHAVTHAMLPPAAVKRYASILPHGNAMPSVKYLRIVGGGLSAQLVEIASTRLTPNVYLPYGISEVGAISMAMPEDLKNNPTSAGRVKAGVKLQVVDEKGKVLKPGETGELRAKLPHMLKGYLQDDQKTSDRFKNGWFHTNDIGYISEDGLVFIDGRKDDRINLGGNKFYPERVERVFDSMPQIAEIAVFQMQIEGEPKLAAAVVWQDKPEIKAFEAFCQDKKLGRMTPQVIATVTELPRNPAGKVLRAQLPEMLKRTSNAKGTLQ